MHERGAGELARDIAPSRLPTDDAVVRVRLGRDTARGVAREAHLRREIPVAHRQIGARQLEHAVAHVQLLRVDFESKRGLIEEQATHFGAGKPHRGAADLDRLAARGVPLVGCARSVAGNDIQALERHVQFLGGNLRDCGDDALAELHLAAEHGDSAAGFETHPAVQAWVGFQTERQDRRAHRDSFAARRIARRMRTCVPQRHRWRSSAAVICASSGSGFFFSSAAAAMTMPLMQ